MRFLTWCMVAMVSRVICNDGTVGEELNQQLDEIRSVVYHLSSQVAMQQLATEERVRSSGDSGIKQIRINEFATNPYMTQTHTKTTNSAIHDHSNNRLTVGMSEVIAVLNGVEFRTRHNDFQLRMPDTDSFEYHATKEIPFPDVPEAVLNKSTVPEQVAEMQLWFKAFKDQDDSERNYKNHFKPVLCYMEGAWTISGEDDLDEPFSSDRHKLEARSWFDLQQKIRYTSGTGGKSNLENFAFLPTTIASIGDNKVPTYAQWNYRILCHPLSEDVPTKRFRYVEDFSARMLSQKQPYEQIMSRAARFSVNPLLDDAEWPEEDFDYKYGWIDKAMYEIPGKNNYGSFMSEKDVGEVQTSVAWEDPGTTLNAANYHRVFLSDKSGAMGLRLRQRGFNAQNNFVSFNNQSKIMSLKYKDGCNWRGENCDHHEERVSYAIPLEIIYLTPLAKWNPYDIEYKGEHRSDEGKTVTANGRNGGQTQGTALDGTNSKNFYQTPKELFSSSEVARDSADTASSVKGVLDRSGTMRLTSPSGTRIFLPNIGGLGPIRTRYPINPIFDEGANTRKEVEALKATLLGLRDNMHMLTAPLNTDGAPRGDETVIVLRGESSDENLDDHDHTIRLTPYEVKQLTMYDEQLTKMTSHEEGHVHFITFYYDAGRNKFRIRYCDERGWSCRHHVDRYMAEEGEEEEEVTA